MNKRRAKQEEAVHRQTRPRRTRSRRRAFPVKAPLSRSTRSARFALQWVVSASLLLGATGSASAQVWLQDRAMSEGAGVRLGDFELHPGIGIQGGYDSNYFLRTDKTGAQVVNGAPGAPVQATPEMLVTPSISVATLGSLRREGETNGESPSVTFRATASGTYREFFGQLSPEQRNGSIDAAANLGILPGRPWGGSMAVTYDRVIQPNTNGNPDLSFTRDVLAANAEIAAQPGSGTLDWHLGGGVSGTLFEDNGGLGYNNLAFNVATRGRWKFRPKTALIYDASLGFQSYTNTTAGAGVITPLHSSDPVRTRIGINGLITPRFSLLALAGYGGSFFSPGSSVQVKQYDSVIANAEMKFFLTAPPEAGQAGGLSLSQSSLSLGYTRDFQTSYISDFYGLDRGYLKFSYFFAGRAVINLEGGAGAIEYPELFVTNASTHSAFTDMRIDGTVFTEYRFTNYLGLNGTFRYTTNLSGAEITLAPNQVYAMQWQRFEAYLGVRLFL